MPSSPVEAPTTTPTISPEQTPWPERFTDPERICPQQQREEASPDVMP